MLTIRAQDVIIEGTPVSTEPNATRAFRANPAVADVVNINAQRVWIRHGTTFESTQLDKDVVIRIDADIGVYVDDDVNTSGRGACPCIDVHSSRIQSVSNVTTDHGCPSVPKCLDIR